MTHTAPWSDIFSRLKAQFRWRPRRDSLPCGAGWSWESAERDSPRLRLEKINGKKFTWVILQIIENETLWIKTKHEKQLVFYDLLPFLPSTMMSSLSSLLQTICGLGWPLASQVKVMFSPSRTTRSVSSSRLTIRGGTENGFRFFSQGCVTFNDKICKLIQILLLY